MLFRSIALNSVSIGVTDNITVGGLLSFVGAGASLKIGKEIAPNVHASFGGIGFKDYVGELDRPVGLVFANITWGTEDRNLTVNIGTGSMRLDDNFQITVKRRDWLNVEVG